MKLNSISIIVLIFGLLTLSLAAYAWYHRATRGSKLIALFMVSISVYGLGYSMELSSLTLSEMIFWSKISYLGLFAFPTLFLIFVLQYANHEKWLAKRYIFLMFLVPSILLFAKLTDGIYHLVYARTWVDTGGMIPQLGFIRGPIYPFAAYTFLPIVIGVLLLLQKQKNLTSLYREQINWIVLSVMIPVLVFFMYMLGIQPLPSLKYLDYNAFTYPLWGIGVAVAMFRYRLFELAPIARDALVERLSEGVIVLDNELRIVDANPAAKRIFGWITMPIGQYVEHAFEGWKDLKGTCISAGIGEAKRFDVMHNKRNIQATYDISMTPILDDIGKSIGKLIVIHDITERKKLEEKLRELSLVDELTGLSNRRGFFVLAQQFITMSNRMDMRAAVVFADVDYLKVINDTYGHAEGDQALIDLAYIFKSTFRASDIVARLSGDEFVILATESAASPIEDVLARFDKHLEKFNQRRERKYQLSISFGISHYYPEKTRTLEELMQDADKSMYTAKSAKKVGQTV